MSDNELAKEALPQEELQTVSIGAFERPVLLGNYAEAEKVLQQIMYNQRLGKMQFNLQPAGRNLSLEDTNIEAFQIIEKLSTLLTIMFSDPKYVASTKMFNEYLLGKRFIANLFATSSYQNTDHIVRNLGLDKRNNFSKADIRKFLIVYIPESTFDLPWVMLAQHMPAETSLAYIGLMSSVGLLMSDTACIQSNKLAAIAKDMPVIKFSRPVQLETMTSGYFHVSNLTGLDKYEFKKWASKNYQAFMEQYLSDELKQDIKKTARVKPRKSKQTVLIIHEKYTNGHAMYRCWHSLLSSIKEQFNVIGTGSKDAVDEVGIKDHHEYLAQDEIYDLDKFIKSILKIKPDVIIYPSIGMSNYSPLLASTRLAPIQIMCGGHPSSSYIPNVDYFFLEKMGMTTKELKKIVMEDLLLVEPGLTYMVPRDYEIKPITHDDSVCNIVVNGVIQKITADLITLCQKMTEGINKPVVFHFFMSTPKQDLEFYAALSNLRRKLPNNIIHPYSSYNDYMNIIANCDFAIPTIPFGGANSDIDVLRLGLPKLFLLDKDDIPGATDYQVFKGIDAMHGYCENREHLLERAIELGNNAEELLSFKNKLKEIDIDSYLAQHSEDRKDTRLSDAITKLIKG